MISVRLMMALLPSPRLQLPTVIAVVTCAWGIISVWAATSKWPWYSRAMVICLLLSCLGAIPAYEPVLYFLLQSTVVVIGVTIWSTRQRDSLSTVLSDMRFSLRSLLFVTVFMGLFLSILARMEWHAPMIWASLFSTGLASGIATLLAAWLSTPCSTWGRRLGRIFLAVLLTALCAIPAVATDGLLLNFPDWARTPGAAYDPTWIILLLGILFGIHLWLLLWSRVFQHAGENRFRRSGGLALLAWSIVLAVPCIDIYLSLPPMLSAPASNMIEDNGFADIEEAALELYVGSAALGSSAESTSAQIKLGLDQNTETLAAIRRGLSKRCMREPDYNFRGNWSSIKTTIGRMRIMARMLLAEGELAKREGRIDDAIVSYVDIIRLSHATQKGALMVDALVARAMESMALLGVSRIRDQLNPAQRRHLAKALSDLDHQREDHQTIYDRDVAWGRVVFGWRGLLSETLEQSSIEDALIWSLHRLETQTRLFIVEFAIEDYQLEHGTLPTRLEDLALDADLLRDPFSTDGHPLQYRIEGEGFLVFSFGVDGDNDDGRPPSPEDKKTPWIGDGDYRLDALYADEE